MKQEYNFKEVMVSRHARTVIYSRLMYALIPSENHSENSRIREAEGKEPTDNEGRKEDE